MTEAYNPGAVFAARRELVKTPKIVLSEDFAKRVNILTGFLSREYELASLFAPWDAGIGVVAAREGRIFQDPPAGWQEFMESISHQEYVQLRRLARVAYRRYGCRTLEDMRELGSGAKRGYGIGQQGRAFAVLAFQSKNPQEASDITLGL